MLTTASAIRTATAAMLLVALTGCSTLPSVTAKWRDQFALATDPIAKPDALATAAADGEQCRSGAGSWLANARDELINLARNAAGGAGGALKGALGGAGVALLSLAKTGGCADPATCGSVVAGVVTVGAVIGGVMGFAQGVRQARLGSGIRTRPQPQSDGAEDEKSLLQIQPSAKSVCSDKRGRK